MFYVLNKSMENLSSLRHFHDIQSKYIANRSKKGMKEYRIGFLTDMYFATIIHGSDEDKSKPFMKKLETIVKEGIEILNIKDASVVYKIIDESKYPVANVSKAAKLFLEYAEMPTIHANNTLIMLITRFEEFVSDMILFIYSKYPERYLDKQTITYSEIANEGIDKIREKILSREIDKIMRENYSAWFKLFEEHNIKLDQCPLEFEILKELYARRNILVHNSGKVNDSYKKNVSNTTYNIGDQLSADEDYINQAFEAVKTIIFCILLEAIKLEKGSAENIINKIFNCAFEELNAENYNTCKTVFGAISKNKFADDKNKCMSKINYWIASIELNEFECVKPEILKFDTSALDESFNLAKLILLQKYKQATPIMESLYKQNKLTIYAIKEWPLFKNYRESEDYATFVSKHPELSGSIESESSTENFLENINEQDLKAELE